MSTDEADGAAPWDEAAVTSAERAYGAAEDDDDAEAAIRQLWRAFGVEVGDDDSPDDVAEKLYDHLQDEAALERMESAVVNVFQAYRDNDVEDPDALAAVGDFMFGLYQRGYPTWEIMDAFVAENPEYPPEIRSLVVDRPCATYDIMGHPVDYFQGTCGAVSMLW